jgi:hypothetical protein
MNGGHTSILTGGQNKLPFRIEPQNDPIPRQRANRLPAPTANRRTDLDRHRRLPALPPSSTPTSSPTSEPSTRLALQLNAPSSALLPGESAVLTWQALGWNPGLSDLRLELNLPQALSPATAPGQVYDPQSGELELPILADSGQIILLSQEDAKGSFTVQACLRQGPAVVDHQKYSSSAARPSGSLRSFWC